MTFESIPEELVQHLCRSTTLQPDEAARVVAEVIHFYRLTPEEFVAQRHQELQRAGVSNSGIYRTIEQELTERVFRSPKLSIRQIRRLIYG